MPIHQNSLSETCRSIADFLETELLARGSALEVSLGPPVDADQLGDNMRVNLFFYHFESFEFGPSPAHNEPWRLRLRCLVTAFGKSTQEEQQGQNVTVGAGENEMRLLGHVLQIFHDNPILAATQVGQGIQETIRVRVVFEPLNIEQLNNLWSTQAGIAYRPSLSYEMSLAPILPEQAVGQPPRVTTVSPDVSPNATFTPPDWAPSIALVLDENGSKVLSDRLTLQLGLDPIPAQVQVLIAGAVVGENVTLVWESWQPGGQWTQQGGGVIGPAILTDLTSATQSQMTNNTVAISLPITNAASQMLLFPQRTFQRTDNLGNTSNHTVRGNPLLITLYTP